jgi:hypothetical protein
LIVVAELETNLSMLRPLTPWFTGLLLLLLTAGLPTVVTAQTTAFGFEFRDVAKVVQGADTLRNAWAGGLDSPQFSSLDLNADGQPDLFIFDRRTRRVLTYLNAPAPDGGRRWQYAPSYAALFPAGLQNWALLRDYDCDGRPDLFTAAEDGANVRVFRNVAGPDGRPVFQLAVAQIRATLTGTTTINVNTGSNLPAFTDVDGNGRLDILVVDWDNNRVIYYYQNTSTDPCGGLRFRLANESWGNIQNCLGTCGSYVFSTTPVLCRPSQVQHTSGSNLTVLDLDGDGDQDALMGRDFCSELVSMTNQGTPQQALMTSANANFPTAATAIRLPYFPAAYHLDVNFDGRPDLLAAPNVYDNLDSLDTRRSVLFYENTSPGAAPNFQFRQPDFLQQDMVEVSSQAAPAFLDVDADGLLDMLVAGVRRDAPAGFLLASIAYYRNVGTSARPVYRLITNDYLGLRARKFGALRPTVADLNRDGAPELVCAGFFAVGQRPFLGYFPNQAPAGQAPEFNTSTLRLINNLPNALGDNAAFFDVDNDSFVDLLYATNSTRFDVPGQSLRYYRNNGSSPPESAFVVANADFGQIRAAAGGRPRNLYPVVADFDGDNTPDLLTADASGQVRLFSNLRAQSGIFLDRTSLFYNTAQDRFDDGYLGAHEQNHFALAAADVNGGGGPELFIGLEAGGVLAAAPRNRALSTSSAAKAVPLTLYPNPATATATVEAPRPVRVTLLDLTGRIVRTATTPARQHQLDLRGLAAGVYVVRCETLDGQLGVQRLVVK